MTDIYKPPESNLEVNTGAVKKPHVLWRVFFWINAVTLPLILILLVLDPVLGVLDYLDILVFMYSLVGLFSYAYSKRLLAAIAWKLSLPLYLLWFVYYEILAPLVFEIEHYGEPAVVDAYITISLAFVVPTAYAFYRLSFKTQ